MYHIEGREFRYPGAGLFSNSLAEDCRMDDNATLAELDARIAAIRENINDLIEQAAAYSGAADEDRAADRIADQEARLEALLKQRDALVDKSKRG
jgi:hypothetical protein